MRFLAQTLIAPLALALVACGPFGSAPTEQEKATVTVETKGTAGQTATPATTTTPATPVTPAATGGKGEVASATTTTSISGGPAGAVTDGKTSGASTPAATGCSDAQNRNVAVINDTRTTLRELYGSNVNRTSWEEDVLGSDVLGAGNRVNVNWDDGTCMCQFDLKAVFSDGTETVRRNFNVCTETAWRIVE